MPVLTTSDFGDIEYGEEQVFRFPEGLPAFEDQKRFLLIERGEFSPLVFLQSVQDANLRFVCIPASRVAPEYTYALADEYAGRLGLAGESPLVLAILTFLPGSAPTANLNAPVLLNQAARAGVQAVQAGWRYSHCHPVGGRA